MGHFGSCCVISLINSWNYGGIMDDDTIVGTQSAVLVLFSSSWTPGFSLNKKNCELDWAAGDQLYLSEICKPNGQSLKTLGFTF